VGQTLPVPENLGETYAHPLGDGWVLFRADTRGLVILNATGKIAWDLLSEGCAVDEVASIFAQHYGLSIEQAAADVTKLIYALDGACAGVFPLSEIGETDKPSAKFSTGENTSADSPRTAADCGTYRFGDCLVRVLSSVANVDKSQFFRFRHRAVSDSQCADVLEVADRGPRYRLVFRGQASTEVDTLTELLAEVAQLLLHLEYPGTDFLAYCHAAAVSRGERGLVLPGTSGVGKSTLTAYLVGNGFAYLGDDLVAIVSNDWALRPLPTCLSIKSGSWPILEKLYPMLPRLPTVHCHGREVRYLEPQHFAARRDAGRPTVIVFPIYSPGSPTRLTPLPPLPTMARLITSHVDLDQPANEHGLREFIRFVEQTPAFELVYSDLRGAAAALGDVLEGSA
jgi:hypothetical protein